jgi:hypothetical protein
VLAGVVGGLAGATRAVNTWDFPLAVLLVATPLAAAALHARARWRTVAVAAVVAAAGLGSLVGALLERPSGPAPAPRPTEVSFLTGDETHLRELPRTQRPQPGAPVREPGLPPEGIV